MAARTIMGLRVLAGEERRQVQRMIAIERAEFEREYAGRKVVPFDRRQIVSAAVRRLGRDIYISDAFVRETRARLKWAHGIVEKFDAEETT